MTLHFVVACGRDKQQAAAPARELYTGAHFRYVLAAAEAEAAATRRDLQVPVAVWILSARYGLLRPRQWVAPYDLTVTDPGAVDVATLAAQAAAAGVRGDDEVYAFLPARYRDLLADALRAFAVPVYDVFEAAPGIGYQRGVCATLRRQQQRRLRAPGEQ